MGFESKKQKHVLIRLTIAFFCFALLGALYFTGGIICLSSGGTYLIGTLFCWILTGLMAFICKKIFARYKLAKTDFPEYQMVRQREKQTTPQQLNQMSSNYYAEQKRQAELKIKRRKLALQGIPSCPKCGSTSIATVNRGYSFVTGFLGSGKAVNICQVCGHKFTPGT